MSVRVLAPAKINPWLDVLARRADGYHELDTTLLALDLCDVVEARVSDTPGVTLELRGPFASADVPRDGTNLASAAAQIALDEARARGSLGARRGLALTLTKNIPSQAGLGGGSSDAAAALAAAERVLGIELAPDRAAGELARLGSDCVFFRAARASGFARCRGRGEAVEPLPPIPGHWRFVVLTPDFGAPTGAVYAELARGLRKPPPVPSLPLDVFARPLSQARALLFNALEDAGLALLPRLRSWRALLDEHGASHFRLAGSGASFFGLFEAESDARAALEGLRSAGGARALSLRGAWVAAAARAGARTSSEPDA